jgi:hypothetical protein
MPKLQLIKSGDPGLSPPRPLGTHGQALWTRVLSEFAIDDVAGREMLCHACAALDTAEMCSAQVQADGPVIRTKGGVVREHPSLRAELANRQFVVRTLARLGLGDEPLKQIGRPPQPLGWKPDAHS